MGNGFGRLRKDLVYIDPDTMIKKCSWNECYEKFNTVHINEEIKNVLDQDFVVKKHWHSCDECGRMVKSTEDKNKDEDAYIEYRQSVDKARLKMFKQK
jgi:hypothetical protein